MKREGEAEGPRSEARWSEAPAEGSVTARTPLRILVVEDDEIAAAALSNAVQALDYTCTLARDGVEALALHRARPFDVVLADWMMPRMSGPELCERIRADADERTYTYFIFLTGLRDREHYLEGMRAGADDYLAKPIDFDELQVRLHSAERVVALNRRLRDMNAKLRRDSETSFAAARVDPLTEVGNRLRLTEDLALLRGRVARYGQRFTAALCDVDLFKPYNDCFGHLAGDEALRRVAETIRRELRTGDAVYRYGGEEFLIVFPEQGVEEAFVAMDRVRVAIERLAIPHVPESPAGVITVSAGVAELDRQRDVDVDAWLARADAALYRAKAAGRNRVLTAVAG